MNKLNIFGDIQLGLFNGYLARATWMAITLFFARSLLNPLKNGLEPHTVKA